MSWFSRKFMPFNIQVGLLYICNYIIYTNEESSIWNNIMIRLLFRETNQIPIAGWLLGIHILQRLYESFFIQKSVSKMSIFHYGVGVTFYFLLPIQFVSAEPNDALEFTAINWLSIISAIISISAQHVMYV